MSRPADGTSGPARPALDIAEIADEVVSRYAEQIAVYRDLLRHIAENGGPDGPDSRWPVHCNPVDGPSLTVPGLRLHLRHSYHAGGALGSFPSGAIPMVLRIHVQGYSDEYPDRTSARSDLLDLVTETERRVGPCFVR